MTFLSCWPEVSSRRKSGFWMKDVCKWKSYVMLVVAKRDQPTGHQRATPRARIVKYRIGVSAVLRTRSDSGSLHALSLQPQVRMRNCRNHQLSLRLRVVTRDIIIYRRHCDQLRCFMGDNRARSHIAHPTTQKQYKFCLMLLSCSALSHPTHICKQLNFNISSTSLTQ